MDSTNDEKIKQAIEAYYSYKNKYTTELKKFKKKYEKTNHIRQRKQEERQRTLNVLIVEEQ